MTAGQIRPAGRHTQSWLRLPAPEDPDAAVPAWHQAYAGLSEEKVAEVECIVSDRSHFTG